MQVLASPNSESRGAFVDAWFENAVLRGEGSEQAALVQYMRPTQVRILSYFTRQRQR